MTLRTETALLTLLILKPLVAIPLPAPRPLALPAPKIAGLLPEGAPRPLSRAARRLQQMDEQLAQIFQTTLRAGLSAKPAPVPLF